jgi:hypothetical protein
MLVDLYGVAAAKFLPAGGIVAEPFPQRGAGRDVLDPLIDGSVHFPDAARPQPVDQYAGAIIGSRGLVGSLELDTIRRNSLAHQRRSE